MKIKKFIDKKIEGEFEIIRHHVIDIDVDKRTVEYVCSGYLYADGDIEWDFEHYGVLFNEDGEPAYIKIGKFLDAIDKKAHETGDSLESDDYDEMQKLEKYKDYDLWMN